jgi:polar amino acid transport system substrate-binding protein
MFFKTIISLALIVISTAKAGYAHELTIVTEKSPPFNFVKDGVVTGSSTEVVREMLRRMGRPDDIRVLPWARGYKMLQTQPYVALFSTSRTPERESQFYWVGPLFTVHFGFYARKSAHLVLLTLEDAKRVGAIATYKDDVKEQVLISKGFKNLDSSKSPVSSFKKLMSGRVDLWLFDNLGVADIARQKGADPNELELVLPFESYQSYLAVSRSTPESVVIELQNTLEEMVRDGTFESISRKWLPDANIPDFNTDEKTAVDKPVLKLYTEDSPPGNYIDNGQPAGFSVDIVREILRRQKQPDTITVVPWARGYTLAMTDPNVALFSTSRLPEREKSFQWVGPLYTQTWAFYAKKGTAIRMDSLDEAKKVARIGTYLKDAKEQFLKSRGFQNLVSANRNSSNVKHLLKGNIDLWVSSDFNMPYQVEQAGENPGMLERVYAFRKVDNFIAFSLKTPTAVAHKWQKYLDEIKEDGTYAMICRKYHYRPDQLAVR